MFARKVDAPMMVQVPGPAQDRPSWTKVGAIAALGFIAGVAWPRLAGVRLGPALPETPAASGAQAASSSGPAEPPAASSVAFSPAPSVARSATAPSSPVALSTSTADPAPPPAASASSNEKPAVAVAHGVVLSCTDARGELLKGNACGNVTGLDAALMPRLRKLADCPDAAGSSGKLHLVVHVDFPRKALGADLGRTRGVATSEGLLGCARSDVSGASLTGVTHDNPRYAIAYTVAFGAGASAPASAHPNDEVPADSSADVVWEVALIRDAPKTGKILARLPRGTTLHVGAMKDGWFPVRYGDSFASEGWVYRGAIGK